MGIQRNSTARILSPRAHSETTAVIPTSESAQIEISIQLCQYPENAKRWKRQMDMGTSQKTSWRKCDSNLGHEKSKKSTSKCTKAFFLTFKCNFNCKLHANYDLRDHCTKSYGPSS